jgi:flagellar biosynthetic protein FliR
MNSPLPDFAARVLTAPDLAQLVQGASGAFIGFTLIAARMSGLVLVGPVFGHPRIPLQVRIFLVLATSFVIAPSLLSTSAQLQAGLPVPRSLLEYAGLAFIELAIGAALGLGVLTIMSGLTTAGNLMNQQLGLAAGETLNPEMGSGDTVSGEMLHQLGLVVFLVVGGHSLMVSALLDTFQALPVGHARLSAPAIELLIDLVRQSLVLALQISAPVMATMAVIGLALGFLGHTIPQMTAQVAGFPVRALVGLLVLGLALSGIADSLVRTLVGGIEQMRQILTAL